MDSFVRDVRHAVRNLLRTPGFAFITVFTLALGIGANTAIFSVVNAVILRPLGYPRPERLVYISSQFPQMGFDQFWISPPEFLEFQERTKSFSSVGAFTTGQANLTAPDRPRRLISGIASADLFKVLGVNAQVRADVRRRGDTSQRPAGGAAVARGVAVVIRRPRGRPEHARRDQRHPPHHRRHHAAAIRCRRPARRSLAPARGQPRESAEPRQPLPVPDRTARRRCDAGQCESGARHAARRLADVDRARRPTPPAVRTRRTRRIIACVSTRCRRRSSAARGRPSSSCRAR